MYNLRDGNVDAGAMVPEKIQNFSVSSASFTMPDKATDGSKNDATTKKENEAGADGIEDRERKHLQAQTLSIFSFEEDRNGSNCGRPLKRFRAIIPRTGSQEKAVRRNQKSAASNKWGNHQSSYRDGEESAEEEEKEEKSWPTKTCKVFAGKNY